MPGVRTVRGSVDAGDVKTGFSRRHSSAARWLPLTGETTS